jgi:hypothetical protein
MSHRTHYFLCWILISAARIVNVFQFTNFPFMRKFSGPVRTCGTFPLILSLFFIILFCRPSLSILYLLLLLLFLTIVHSDAVCVGGTSLLAKEGEGEGEHSVRTALNVLCAVCVHLLRMFSFVSPSAPSLCYTKGVSHMFERFASHCITSRRFHSA